MGIFGLESIHATIVVGVLLQVRLGYAESTNIFDGRISHSTLVAKRNLGYTYLVS